MNEINKEERMQGLSGQQVSESKAKYGTNELAKKETESLWSMLSVHLMTSGSRYYVRLWHLKLSWLCWESLSLHYPAEMMLWRSSVL